MPLTIKTGAMYYKDPVTGNYVPINAIGDMTSEMIAPFYEELTFPVVEGTPCVHENVIYRANQAISTSETWTAAHWTAIANVMSEIQGIKSAINVLEPSASAGDVGKVLKAKTVADGKVSEYEFGSLPSVPVTDVQVNGTSILSQGVANVPMATDHVYGAVKLGSGLRVQENSKVAVTFAADSSCKAGTNTAQSITPNVQHCATFYGLAKASGDTTQSASNNTVGTYTDAAKVAIQKMLGIYEAPWELIRGDNQTNATEEDIEITVDKDGNAFELTDIILTFWLDSSSVASSKGSYGAIHFYYDSNSYDTIYVGAWTQAVGVTSKIAYAILEQKDGMLFKSEGENTTSGSQSAIKVIASVPTSELQYPFIIPATKRIYNKIVIKKVTGKGCYRIFGKRKWD